VTLTSTSVANTILGAAMNPDQEASLVRVALLRCNMSKLKTMDAQVRTCSVLGICALPFKLAQRVVSVDLDYHFVKSQVVACVCVCVLRGHASCLWLQAVPPIGLPIFLCVLVHA